MPKKLIITLAALVLLVTTHANAVGLGDITLESSLNQPLSARIALHRTQGLHMDEIRVALASRRDFERFSLERIHFLESLRFDVNLDADQPYIALSTREPVREPFLSFVLDTNWPEGRVLTEYTILVDPPAFASAVATQQPQPPASSISEEASGRSGETVAGSSEAPAGAGEEMQVAPETAIAAPGPTATSDTDADVTSDTPLTQTSADQELQVDATDTLWDIALRVRPDNSISVQQTMLALQQHNPDAFINNNINLLRNGAILRIPPSSELRALSQLEAVEEVGRQNQQFSDAATAQVGSQPLAAPPETATEASGPSGELQLVTGDEPTDSSISDSVAAESAEVDTRIRSVENELAISQEELDRVERENEELQQRLAMLEEQIESARELIRLRDVELAQLQDSLASEEAAEEAAVPAASPEPTQVTMAPEAGPLERIMNTLMQNTLLLLGLIVLLILLLVLFLVRRNRAKQAALADERENDEEQNLDFSRSGAALAAAASRRQGVETEEAGLAATADSETEPEDPSDIVADGSFDAEVEEEPSGLLPDEVETLLAEVDGVIEHRQYDLAQNMLQDAIVADPDEQALRVKMLQVLAAQEDFIGFRLQESELGELDTRQQEQVDTLREQIAALEGRTTPAAIGPEAEVDAGVTEESSGDLDDFSDIDNDELELDMEASADVDDEKVRGGTLDDDMGGRADALATQVETVQSSEGDVQEEPRPEPEDDYSIDWDLSDADIAGMDEKDDIALETETTETEDRSKDDFSFDDWDLDAESEGEVSDFEDVGDDKKTAAGDEQAEDEFDFSLEDFELDTDPEGGESEVEVVTESGPESTVADTREVVSDNARGPEEEDTASFDLDMELSDEDNQIALPGADVEEVDEFDQELESLRDAWPESDSTAEGRTAPEPESEQELESLRERELEPEEPESELEPGLETAEPEPKSEVELQPAPEPAPATATTKDGDAFEDLEFSSDDAEALVSKRFGDDDGDFGFLSGSDEAATKLDLARAYIDMGDAEGAREILDEVVDEGTETQVKEARELMGRLG